jgi:hypothetical protein
MRLWAFEIEKKSYEVNGGGENSDQSEAPRG